MAPTKHCGRSERNQSHYSLSAKQRELGVEDEVQLMGVSQLLRPYFNVAKDVFRTRNTIHSHANTHENTGLPQEINSVNWSTKPESLILMRYIMRIFRCNAASVDVANWLSWIQNITAHNTHAIYHRVNLYMIVCLYGNCVAGCNQEPVQTIVAQAVSRYSGWLIWKTLKGVPADP